MNFWIASLVGLGSAILASLGLGGGSVLLIYLTVIAGMNQMAAQGINLIFFIPIAIVALIIHIKNKLIDIKTALWSALFGIAGVFGGYFLARFLGDQLLGKAFAVLLFLFGLSELFHKKEKKGPEKA